MTDSIQQQQFLTVLDRDEAERRFRAVLDLRPLDAEVVALADAWQRVLAEDVVASIDVPGFDRSNVDGFAVRAVDTFGAAEDAPCRLRLNAEVVAPGRLPSESVAAGTATPLATGAVLPRGADAVVMIEHTDASGEFLRLTRPVAPGANVTFAGSDIGRGETVLRSGSLLTSRETGVLAALGYDQVAVVRRPRVAILSTGDEIVLPGQPLAVGQVYDSNSTVLADAVRELGGMPVPLGSVPDDLNCLRTMVRDAVTDCDMVLLSGGTSKGAGDVSYRAVAELGPPGIVAHGIALKPGKPLCLAVVHLARRRPVPVAVLPGFPTSAVFTFHEFLAPVLRSLAGRTAEPSVTITATLPVRVNSERGRTEFVLVGLVPGSQTGELTAYPMGKGSGSVTAFGLADGFLTIARQQEYLEAGETVTVRLLGAGIRPADLIVIGSHCLGLDDLLGLLHRQGFTSKCLNVGSVGGLEAARRGECDVAGVHLLDAVSNIYNHPFVPEGVELVPGYGRWQGLVHRPDDPRFRTDDLTAVLTDASCVLMNRNRGSGTRLLIERLLNGARPTGYLTEAKTHSAVVTAIAQGRADWGVAIEAAARDAGLAFRRLREERYDFLVPRSRWDRPAVQGFRAVLASKASRDALQRRGFRLD